MSTPAVTLLVDPGSYHFENDRLFDADSDHMGDHLNAPYAALRSWMAERGVPTHTADRLPEVAGAVNVYVSLGMRRRWRSLVDRDDVVLSAFFALECPIVEPRLYRDLDDLAPAFRRLYSYAPADALRPFLRRPLTFLPYRIPQAFDRVHERLWSQRGRAGTVLVNANKRPRLTTDELYSERLRAIAALETRGGIDLYGPAWDGPAYRLGETRVPATVRRIGRWLETPWDRRRPGAALAAARRAWRGPTPDKPATLARYRFCICYENMALPGYVSEKLFDCFFAGTVPVYLGAPDIADWVPSTCYVDRRDFSSYGDLADHLEAMGDAEWQAMRESARDFLASAAFRPFSTEAFCQRIADLVQEDTGARP